MIQIVGTNHRMTPVTVRERLGGGLHGGAGSLPQEARKALASHECVLLSTCNRVEVYFVAPPGHSDLRAAEGLFSGLAGTELAAGGHLYHHQGAEAVAHLFSVASGLDSMVLGEHEIMAQVKDAVQEVQAGSHCGPVLARLFRHALRTGKRARRETAISSGIFSVGQCATRRAQEVMGDLHGKRLLVFGAGRVAHITAKHMAKAGAGPITVYSRTRVRAEELAAPLGARAVDGIELMDALRESDIVVGCANAPHHLVGCAEILEATKAREGRPLAIIDLGVPRNVDPAVAELPGVRLFNIDDLEAVVAESAGARQADIARVGEIVQEEVAEFCRWQMETQAKEVIARLRAKAEAVRQQCLARASGKAKGTTDGQTLDYLTDLLVRKLLHEPILALRRSCATQACDGADLAEAAEELFGLGDEG